MARKANVLKVATFCLNLETASASSYQTWVTVRLLTDFTLERLTNEGGNGQHWEVFGYGSSEETKLFSSNATETQQARIFAHCVGKIGTRCNVAGFGAAWSKATIEEPRVNPLTGRTLTAAPSIREGKPPRDKNRSASYEAERRHGENSRQAMFRRAYLRAQQ